MQFLEQSCLMFISAGEDVLGLSIGAAEAVIGGTSFLYTGLFRRKDFGGLPGGIILATIGLYFYYDGVGRIIDALSNES